MFPLCLLVPFLSVLLNTESTPLSPRGAESTDCSIGSGQLAGYIGDPIHEASGLAVSRMNPGVLYTHPDSQHTNHVWAMAYGAQVLAEVVLEGCTNHDWEDIAVTGSHVYVADTGNNQHNRYNLRILRFPEPVIDQTSYHQVRIPRSSIEYLDFTYPGYNHDCEAMAVDPITHDIFLFTKDWTEYKSEVYRYPMSKREAGKSLTLEYITTLPMKYVTGADISPTGNTLAITNLAEGYSYTKTAGVSWGDFLKGYGSYFCTLRINYLPQMEAIAVTEDGYWSTTENCDYCPIWYYPRY